MTEHTRANIAGPGFTDVCSLSSQEDIERGYATPDLSAIPTRLTSGSRRTPNQLTETRSIATDGFSVTDLDNNDSSAGQDLSRAEKVPTSDFEVGWDGDNDPVSPRNFSTTKKWLIVFVICISSFLVTCASSLYTATYGQLMEEFHCSREVATLGLTTFVFGLGFGPMLLAPLSEFYGRRPIYVASLGFFFIWIIPCAVAQNIETMVIVRFFGGFAGSAFLAVAGGTMVDLFDPSEIGLPMMFFTLAPFLGPSIGPVIGCFINYFIDWRWTFYVLLIWTGVLFVTVVLFVPETYHKVILKQKAQRKRKETGNDAWYAPIEKTKRTVSQTVIRSCAVPVKLLVLEPMCLFLCLYSAVLLGIVYLFFGAFPLVFGVNHDFKLWQSGLSFLGICVGMIVGVATDPYWRRNYQRLVRNFEAASAEKNVKPEPEFRLPPAMFGSIFVVIGIFWFGWTTYSSIHWIVPIAGSAIYGMGLVLCFSGIFAFLVDAYPAYAASAIAANCLVRLLFAGVFPLFGIQMYNTLGFQWASSLLGFIALACLPMPFLFFKYGRSIRARSKFTQ